MTEITYHADCRQALAVIRQRERVQESQTNAVLRFYALFNLQFEVVPQPVGQMPWRRPLTTHKEGILCPSI